MNRRIRPEDVEGEPLFADVNGVRTTTGRWPNRRIECRSCLRKFLPYVAEVIEKRDALKAEGASVWVVGDPSILARFTACPSCGASRDRSNGRGWWDARSVGLRVRRGSNLCDTACAMATGGDCKCECLGMNHGAAA